MAASIQSPAVKSCVVLGGKGFVGRAVVEKALSEGYEVTIVDRQGYEQARGTCCDLLVNANGNSKKYLSRQDPGLDFDLSVRSVARSLDDFPAKLYVYLSSIDVYPNTSDPDTNGEESPIDPQALSTYGFHKYLAEQVVQHRAAEWVVLRMGGFVGPGLWKNSIHDLLTGEPLRVHPDSAYQYLHTGDLARILFQLVRDGACGEVLNVAGDGLVTLREVAEQIPGARLPDHADALPKERYEVNVDKLKALTHVPHTRETVAAFIRERLT